MRPRYETEGDLLNEGLIACEFLCQLNTGSAQYAGQKIKENGGYVPDYRIINEASGRVIGYMEIKRRNYRWNQIVDMGGLFLSLKKYEALKDAADRGFRVAFVVQTDDLMGYYSINDCLVRMGEGGRQDRDDPADVEQMVFFDPEQIVIFQQTGEQ
jgi:hypothetical protein